MAKRARLKQRWRITVWDSTTSLAEFHIGAGCITEDALKTLLMALAAKHGLSDEETVNCYLKRGTRGRSNRLDVQESQRPFMRTCGQNPHVAAVLVDENDSPISAPPPPK